VDRINLLIENLLNLARQRVSHKTSFPAARLFDEISLLYTKVAENSRIVLSFAAEEGLVLYADEAEIKQVLINLINNSFKAIGSGGSGRGAGGRPGPPQPPPTRFRIVRSVPSAESPSVNSLPRCAFTLKIAANQHTRGPACLVWFIV